MRRFLDIPTQRRLCGNAAHKRTFVPGASRSLPYGHFLVTLALVHRILTTSALFQHSVQAAVLQKY
ncbi:hypothetical protein C0Z16_11660 [Paraburkholderia rhynchosiae]|uniref:Uncharacterized protein n=1 Tax=Paraburkholderia rhynchosiae TaxID=487049 RepID=A0ABX4V7I3_9BURK|nr:hypothetical protein C0Z16_11660 [Paraburkholderia rhynchosiae]